MEKAAILEEGTSISSLINSSPSNSTPPLSAFHLPNTRVYPQITLVPKNINNKGQLPRSTGRKVRIRDTGQRKSQLGICFTIGLALPLLALLIAWNLNLITFSLEAGSASAIRILGTRLDSDGFDSSAEPQQGFCTSSICMQASSRLLLRLNSSHDPCHDFYEFSCGSFTAGNEIPDDGFQRSTLQEMQETLLVEIKKLIDQPGSDNENLGVKKARQLYSSCMHNNFRTSHYADYKDLPIFSVLTEEGVGSWPILRGLAWNASEFKLERLFSQLFAYQVQSILKLYVSPDETDPSKYLLEFYKGEPGMAAGFFTNTSEPDYVKYVRSYKRLVLESVLILTHGKQGSTVMKDVDSILNFETEFAKIVQNSKCHLDGGDYTYVEDDYGHVTLHEISVKLPQINWLVLIQNLFDNLGLKRNVTEDMVLYFHCSDFFPNLISLLERTDKRTVTNYLIWRFVFRYMPFLGNSFLQIWMEFMKDVPDTNEEKLHLSRWKQCASIVNDGFGLALTYLYVHNSMESERALEKVGTMIHYLKKAYEQVIHEQAWLPSYFRNDLIEKLMSMGEKIGYPSYILDTVALEKEYDGLEFDEEYFLMNILNLRKFEVLKEIRRVNQAVDKEKDWIILPLVANAFHNPTANEIVIPLGILRYPMYSPDYPMYLNFANLGIVIGHEMTHGFDHQGRFYDKNGNFTIWWPDEVVTGFRKQAICFTEQYSRFEMPLIQKGVDGNGTLADNICDNSALRLSWLAYELWKKDNGPERGLPGVNYTIPQIFYMTYAQIWCEVVSKEGYEQYLRDTHAPGEFRAQGVAMNNKYFGKIFNCPVGSNMNPPNKCVLWS